ncbi:E3 ubiquitin-protein ligase RNF213-like [Bufo bufo]|uniref:E3 ubiquitin-protein ligase RNF213-like n=1 Tax=Bufo bufo TaxID=8384 RepID=UPI001ABEB6FD|nr:E3 ubiquitin-protein ligase RNF213-like [Bufo bufo]
MKCWNCGHEPPKEKARFCSMCKKSMRPPAPISTAIQEDTNKNSILLSEIEMEPGKELVLDESKIPACIEPASIAEREPPSLGDTGPPSKKRKRKSVEKPENQQNEDGIKASSSSTNEVPNTSASAMDQDLEICFHVIISKEFGLKVNEDKVIVKAENITGYENWKSVVCEMHYTKELKDFGFLYEGCTHVSKNNLNKNIQYKYVVLQSNGREEYEYIYGETTDKLPIINRCLFMPSNYIIKGEWHQYDDVCLKKNEGFLKSLKKSLENVWKSEYKSIYEKKMKAGEIMLSSIYTILETCDEINLSGFFQQLQQFYYVAARFTVDKIVDWHSQKYDKEKVNYLMMTLLNKICDPFINTNKQQESNVRLNRLIAGLICLWIARGYGIHGSKEHLTNICCILCLDEMPREKLIDELKNAKTLFGNFPGTYQALKQLCQQCIEENVEHWVWVLPVLHTFSHVSNTESSMPIQEDVWAGLGGLAYSKSSWDVFGKMVKKKYLLQSHPMVIQSWLCLISVNEMVKFLDELPVPIVAVLKACYFKIPVVEYYQLEEVKDVLKKILQIMKEQVKPLDPESFEKCCKASLGLHYEILNNKLLQIYSELAALSAEIILTFLTGLSNGGDETKSLQPEIEKVFDSTMSLTIKWLKDVYGQKFTFEYYTPKRFPLEMQAWNLILKAGENATQKWKDSLLSLLCNKIKQEDSVKQIVIYCKEQRLFQELHPSIHKCFEDCAIEAVHSACQSENNILRQLDTYNLANFEHLVSSVILNSWPKDDHGKCVQDNDRILQHLLQWDDATYIFKLYGTDSRIIEHINEEIQELVAISDSVFLEARKSVIDGTVPIKHLEYILKSKKKFLDICRLKAEKRENISVADIRQVLEWRGKELKTIKTEREWVGSLLNMINRIARSVKVNVSEVRRKYSANLEPQKLNDLTPVKILGESIQGDSVSYYQLSSDLMDMAHYVHTLTNSHVFITCWGQQGHLLANSIEDSFESQVSDKSQDEEDVEITLVELKDRLFTPCLEHCKIIYENLKTGEITFEVADDFLEDFRNRSEQLKEEFRALCCLGDKDSGRWISKRVMQIKQYHQLDVAFRSAKVIYDVKCLLNLSGNFQTLTTLQEFADDFENCKQKSLSCINDEVMKTRKLLSEIKDEHIECLKELLSAKDFLQWVREELEDVNELKVFVDLASISAGENDMDVDRVACFHDAVLGYSSLLYELNSNSGFDDLMACLQKLWKALKSDRNLSKKLRDSARHIEWLKTVKESHGSVELSSLSLATTINKRGIYVIQAPKDNQKITPDSVMQLNLQEEGDSRINERSYNLEELKELLNKLMLMSAKGDQSNQEVEKFSEIFSNVQRLSRSFIYLYLAGNMLFRTWKAEIYCSDDAPTGICMRFDVNGIDKLEEHGPPTSLLPDICSTMENLLEKWLEFMNQKRSQLYYLNYYTAEQLVFLCQEFQRRDISEEALVMLSFIKPQCQKIYTKSCYTETGSTGVCLNRLSFALKFANCANVLEKLEIGA